MDTLRLVSKSQPQTCTGLAKQARIGCFSTHALCQPQLRNWPWTKVYNAFKAKILPNLGDVPRCYTDTAHGFFVSAACMLCRDWREQLHHGCLKYMYDEASLTAAMSPNPDLNLMRQRVSASKKRSAKLQLAGIASLFLTCNISTQLISKHIFCPPMLFLDCLLKNSCCTIPQQLQLPSTNPTPILLEGCKPQ